MLAALAIKTETPELPDAHWYATFSTGNSMERTLECLTRHYGKARVYYPKVREMRPVGQRKLSKKQRRSVLRSLEPILVPLWTRYVLIRFSLLDGHWHDLFELAHIRGLLCDDSGGRPRPAPLADEIIAGIQAMEVAGAIPARATIKRIAYEIGEEVRINAGSFSGHNGIVDRLPDVPIEQLDESDRLRLLVSLFGRRTPIELALSDIEKL